MRRRPFPRHLKRVGEAGSRVSTPSTREGLEEAEAAMERYSTRSFIRVGRGAEEEDEGEGPGVVVMGA